jgi:hypothetical protein
MNFAKHDALSPIETTGGSMNSTRDTALAIRSPLWKLGNSRRVALSAHRVCIPGPTAASPYLW